MTFFGFVARYTDAWARLRVFWIKAELVAMVYRWSF